MSHTYRLDGKTLHITARTFRGTDVQEVEATIPVQDLLNSICATPKGRTLVLETLSTSVVSAMAKGARLTRKPKPAK